MEQWRTDFGEKHGPGRKSFGGKWFGWEKFSRDEWVVSVTIPVSTLACSRAVSLDDRPLNNRDGRRCRCASTANARGNDRNPDGRRRGTRPGRRHGRRLERDPC